VITTADIELAAERVAGRIRRTPILATEPGAFGLAGAVTLKLELFQHAGSFKARGAFNRMLAAPVGTTSVIAASGGNAGIAVAYAAHMLGLAAEIFVPETASRVKVDRLTSYGAEVTVTGARYADAYLASMARAAETGALVVHAYDHPDIAAGQGTLGRELLQQDPETETIVVAVGGGGLLAGVATWARGRARIIAVEPELCPTLATALKAGGPVDVDVDGVAADALGARRVSEMCYDIAAADDVTSVLVSDQAIMAARQALWDETRIAAEPAGAAALAALTSGAYQPQPGERVSVIVCGGNTNPSDLGTPVS
jgi:threonine dehydratase